MPEGTLHCRWNEPQDGPVMVLSHGFSTPNFIYEQNVMASTQLVFVPVVTIISTWISMTARSLVY
jgi:hypothetical protein